MNIFDGQFSGMSGVDMYRAWVTPELYPNQKRALIENWDPQDIEMYVGGRSASYNRKETDA
ncbi:hypothetical protein SEA_SQUEE_49 [Mycobacterium phage Squee]|uniref:Uncharacterized protein n=1 Tax=Mycobacterium phage JC27 TaxID=2922210 RepID=G1D399_9CAUD|nr:hypothetical protein FH32_gp49 [Mycobacterium phage Lamina13]YP_009197628.1 hypothetical protein AVV04_gp45 [Mycobacterium phage Tasp14]YP_009636775.1 hypothetical protein FGG24_gp50 [Mycobacterium phage JC27]AXH47512.1 hypothetical protein SEA_HOPE4EVER_51 [Mycobacterium phage Hope4ever]QAY03068.1 hypothetical protein SEA_FENN_51 [Mycobacterium phage Fenn]QBI99320.1 hypothetical protein SEA_NAIRA_51 [Mycobacterium phage Naira]USH44411.1 hypothetical protein IGNATIUSPATJAC_49 [Mycobacteriu